jgi:hypothetical protein
MHASCGGGFVLEGPEASDSECSGASSDEEVRCLKRRTKRRAVGGGSSGDDKR